MRPGDVDGAVVVLLADERWGDEIVLLLSQEGRNPLITQSVAAGRRFHHERVGEVFGPFVAIGTSRSDGGISTS